MTYNFDDDDEPGESKDSLDNKERATRWLKRNDRFFGLKEYGMKLSYYVDKHDIRISLSYPNDLKKGNDSFPIQTNQPPYAFEEQLKGTVKSYLTAYHNLKDELKKNEDRPPNH